MALRSGAAGTSLWEVLPRLGWAHCREPFSTKPNAVRLHPHWRLFEPCAGRAKLVAACERDRSVPRQGLLEPGVVQDGDHNESGNYTQVYCALIAALLLSRRGGKLPTKHLMESARGSAGEDFAGFSVLQWQALDCIPILRQSSGRIFAKFQGSRVLAGTCA
jgi:hypothetical protein